MRRGMIGQSGSRWRRSTARSALAAAAVVWVCDAGHTDESFYEASLPEFGDRLEGVLVVQADNRDIQGSKEHIGIGWNSNVCARVGGPFSCCRARLCCMPFGPDMV